MALRISKQLPSEWPLITPAWPLNPAMHYTLVWVFCLPNLVATGHFKGIWPLVDPGLTPAWPLTPAMSYTLIRGSFYQIWWPYGISKPFDLWLTPAGPCMTFDPSNALHSGQGFFPPNVVAIGHCWANWPLLDPSWHLHNLNPSNALHYGQGFFPPSLVAVGHC